jgi:hypothetical protein
MPTVKVKDLIKTLDSTEKWAQAVRLALQSALDDKGNLQQDSKGRLIVKKLALPRTPSPSAAGKACPLRASCEEVHRDLKTLAKG